MADVPYLTPAARQHAWSNPDSLPDRMRVVEHGGLRYFFTDRITVDGITTTWGNVGCGRSMIELFTADGEGLEGKSWWYQPDQPVSETHWLTCGTVVAVGQLCEECEGSAR